MDGKALGVGVAPFGEVIIDLREVVRGLCQFGERRIGSRCKGVLKGHGC